MEHSKKVGISDIFHHIVEKNWLRQVPFLANKLLFTTLEATSVLVATMTTNSLVFPSFLCSGTMRSHKLLQSQG